MFFPGSFAFAGVLPSYIPYLVASGVGRCDCPNPLQFLAPFTIQPVLPTLACPFPVPPIRRCWW